MLKNTAAEPQSLAILACLCHCVVTRSTQASILEFSASVMRIKNKTLMSKICSMMLMGRKKLRTTPGITKHSSMRKETSCSRRDLSPCSAYCVFLKKWYFGFKIYPLKCVLQSVFIRLKIVLKSTP